jgi:hypothetical protein
LAFSEKSTQQAILSIGMGVLSVKWQGGWFDTEKPRKSLIVLGFTFGHGRDNSPENYILQIP